MKTEMGLKRFVLPVPALIAMLGMAIMLLTTITQQQNVAMAAGSTTTTSSRPGDTTNMISLKLFYEAPLKHDLLADGDDNIQVWKNVLSSILSNSSDGATDSTDAPSGLELEDCRTIFHKDVSCSATLLLEKDQGEDNKKLHVTLLLDSTSKHLSFEARLSASLGNNDENEESLLFIQLQNTLIELAVTSIPQAISFISDSARSGINWSITSQTVPQSILEDESSLYNVLLANPSVSHKQRVKKEGIISIWSFGQDAQSTAQGIFVKDTVRYMSNNDASVAHAEALIHPAMISHPKPQRALLISDMPQAPLKELLKYSNFSLKQVDVVGTSHVMKDFILQTVEQNDGYFGSTVSIERLNELINFIELPTITVDGDDNDDDNVLNWAKKQAMRCGFSVGSPPKDAFYHSSNSWPMEKDTDRHPEYESVQEYEQHKARLFQLCSNTKEIEANQARGFDYEREVICDELLEDGMISNYTDDDEKDEANRSRIHDGINYVNVLEENHFKDNTTETVSKPEEDFDLSCYYDVIFMDVPYYDQTKLTSIHLHRYLESMIAQNTGDTMLVMSIGSAPKLTSYSSSSSKHHETRDVFLRQLTRPIEKGGLAYNFATVYDEPLASPLSTAFVVAFQWEDQESFNRFFRTNSVAYDIDLLERAVPYTGSGHPPTLLYDGPTHITKYQTPSRIWEEWYCRTSLFKDLPGCEFFRKWMFDPARHHKNVEPRHHPIKGRSLYSNEYIPKDHFINFDDVLHSIHLDSYEWKSLVKFVETYPDATFYRQLRDFFIFYGFEVQGYSINGWAVSSSSTNTFSNHACTNEDRTASTAEYYIGLSEDGLETKFTPLAGRRPRVAAYTSVAKRDIYPDEQIEMNYQQLRGNYEVDHPYFDFFLTSMCDTGVGFVPVNNNVTGSVPIPDDDDEKTGQDALLAQDPTSRLSSLSHSDLDGAPFV